MSYTKVFDPLPLQDFRTEKEKSSPGAGDRRDGMIYRYTDDIVLAVNVALVTGRPLLIRGPSGSGKSSLAYNVARVLKRRYYELVITSRTQARDLLWRFDAVRRLGDAQVYRQQDHDAQKDPDMASSPLQWENYYPYIEPGVLWWAFDRVLAKRRGHPINGADRVPQVNDPAEFKPDGESNGPEPGPVILLDEIDKADPDFANNLLVPIGSLQFRIEEIDVTVKLERPDEHSWQDLPLIIITTNGERRLPQAFLRRCVTLRLKGPGRDGLIEIARANHRDKHEELYSTVYDAMIALIEKRLEDDSDVHLNVAQYLDAVRACLQLDTEANADLLAAIVEMTV